LNISYINGLHCSIEPDCPIISQQYGKNRSSSFDVMDQPAIDSRLHCQPTKANQTFFIAHIRKTPHFVKSISE